MREGPEGVNRIRWSGFETAHLGGRASGGRAGLGRPQGHTQVVRRERRLLDLVELLVIREEAALDAAVALRVVRAVHELADPGGKGRLLERAAELVPAVALDRPDRERRRVRRTTVKHRRTR